MLDKRMGRRRRCDARVETEIEGFEGGVVWQGPLADAVLYFLELPANEREKAEIVISSDEGTRNSWLRPALPASRMMAVAGRPAPAKLRPVHLETFEAIRAHRAALYIDPMRYDMRPDKIGWTVFDVTTGRTVALDNDLILTGVDHEEADRLVALLHAGAIRWEAAIANEATAIAERVALARETGIDPQF